MNRTRALLWVAGLAGCDPTVEEVSTLVLDGALDQASAAVLAASPDGPLQAWRGTATQWQQVQGQRPSLERAAAEMLQQAIEEGLAARSVSSVAGPLAAISRANPQHPGIPGWTAELEAQITAADPAAAAEAWTTLAAAFDHAPDRQRRYRTAAHQAGVTARYAPTRLAETRAAQRGVGVSAAQRLLHLIDEAYHVAPDWPEVAKAAALRIGWLQGAPGARQAWPQLPDAALPTPTGQSQADALAHLEALVAALGEAGVPEEVVVTEWTAGALAALDPWTRAVWPAEIAAWEAHHAGVHHGLGLELMDGPGGQVWVDHPALDGPAWTSGVRQADRLERVEDARGAVILADLDPGSRLAAAQQAMVGPEGSTVRLSLGRGDPSTPVVVEIPRGPVKRQTVRGLRRAADNSWDLWLDEGMAYVGISAFRSFTEGDFDALVEPSLDDIHGVVLDLRGNPGGDINAAVQIADRFVADGWLAQISGRILPDTGPDVDPETGAQLAEWNQAVPGHALEGTPVVILVDAATASAAEVLAGSLQERADAIVIGEPTWGKGYAQALRTDPEGGFAVQFTNLVWSLPSGRRLARDATGAGGVQPDLVLSLDAAAAFQSSLLRRKRGALRAHADGHPIRWLDTVARDGLPALDEDPLILAGALTLRALQSRRPPPSPTE